MIGLTEARQLAVCAGACQRSGRQRPPVDILTYPTGTLAAFRPDQEVWSDVRSAAVRHPSDSDEVARGEATRLVLGIGVKYFEIGLEVEWAPADEPGLVGGDGVQVERPAALAVPKWRCRMVEPARQHPSHKDNSTFGIEAPFTAGPRGADRDGALAS